MSWRLVSMVVSAVLVVPVVAGLVGVIVPAMGYFPALGAREPGFQVLAAFAAEPGIARSIAVSALSGLVATAVSLVLTALILAAAFATRTLGVAERLLAPILSVPHAAAALGFVFLFAPSGFLLRLVSPWATGLDVPPDIAILRDPWGWSLAAALVVKETPFLFLMALAALRQVRAGERAAVARTLGYGPMTAFLHAVWPLVYRQIRLPVLATLAFAVSVVDMALILGPTRPAPLSVRIVGWLQSTDLADWMIGSAGAFAMAVLAGATICLWLAAEVAVGAVMRSAALSGARLTRDGAVRTLVLSAAGLGVAVVFCGFGGLIVQSFAGYWPFPQTWPGTMNLSAWTQRLPMAAGTLQATLLLALGATVVALPLAVLLLEAQRRGARVWWLIYAPLIAPQVAFLFGLNVLAIAAGLQPGAVAVTLCHALFALPYALIALSGPWQALDPRYEAVAASVGAGPVRRLFTVRLPMLFPPLCVAAALCVAVSVGLYLPTQLIGGGRVVTVTTEAVTAASGGDRRLIGIFASLQLVLPFAAFALARGAPRLVRGVRRAGFAA
ncbi:ABC transporter permease subunit [Acuticoccus sp. MNP-M23]|uniref:ABC transporter permease n=1 Tax=Acuticoccus sp. MNP-M23 TaxID=3072793 RepID=UPI002815F9BE|nr:ABC transporter permease subunit [Acuticoccus sp. MNP-M23]WMS41054.1 ABC transporter permease subunit [Acuticoccus sp. MNP-M23]